jgi:ribonuclease HI
MNGPSAALPDERWQSWFDGSALPCGALGLGIVLVSPQGMRIERSVLAKASGCSNEAELHALCLALELALEHGVRRLRVTGDSDVALRLAGGRDTVARTSLDSLAALAKAKLAGFEECELEWVPRHRNGEADRLSRQALGLPAKPAPRPNSKRRR